MPVIRPERLDVIIAAHLTLGYLYYELGFYREAIKHFAEIPADDPVFPEALLARSWAAIKLEDYQQAIVTLNELIKKSNEEKFTEEAHFLLGQCYLELGFYDFAITEFDYIIERYPASNNIEARIEQVEAGLLEQSKRAEKLGVDLLVLESKLLDILPLYSSGDVPKYIRDERKRLEETREALIKNILEERRIFEDFHLTIQKMKEEVELKRRRKHWRAYAEYGKARAYFLKTIQTR